MKTFVCLVSKRLLLVEVLFALVVYSPILFSSTWNENFEDYRIGEKAGGKGIWEGWGGDSNLSGVIAEDPAGSDSKTLKVEGPRGSAGSNTVAVFQDFTQQGVWELRFDLYIPPGHSGTTRIILLTQYPQQGEWSNIQLAVQEGSLSLAGDTLPAVNGEWRELRLVIDLNANLVRIFYDGEVLVSGVPYSYNSFSLEALELFSPPSPTSPVYFDNMSLEKLPGTAPYFAGGLPEGEKEVFWPLNGEPYTREVVVGGLPSPTVQVLLPEGASFSQPGVLKYTSDPLPSSFRVKLLATNEAGFAEAEWTVELGSLPSEGETAIAGELLVDLSAEDPSAGGETWVNEGTLGDFAEVLGNPVPVSQDGARGVLFNSGEAQDVYQCESETPEGLVGRDATRSIEVWCYNPEISTEETMVSWGRRGGPPGSNMGFNYGNNSLWGAATHWGGGFQDKPWREGGVTWAPEARKWHYLVYTYDGKTTRVYADGGLSSSEELGYGAISTWKYPRILLGAQTVQYTDFVAGYGFSGFLARVRIHDGVLSPEQIAHNFELERPKFGLGDRPPSFVDVPAGEKVLPCGSYKTDFRMAGYPAPELKVLEPGGATISGEFPLYTLTYPLPHELEGSFQVTVEAENRVDTASVSWQVVVIEPRKLVAEPVHRYSFEGGAGDSMGDAAGTVYGDVTFEEGRAVLKNSGGNSSDGSGLFPDPENPEKQAPGAYIELPGGIVSQLREKATFEFWAGWNGPPGSCWQRIFDFGTSDGGQDISDGAVESDYIFLTARSPSGNLRCEYNHGSSGSMNARSIEGGILPADGEEHHLVVVWDELESTVSLYVNGKKQGEDTGLHMSLRTLVDNNNWLGRAQWPDPLFDGSYNEVRIYNYALSGSEVAGNFCAGPDTVNYEPEEVAPSFVNAPSQDKVSRCFNPYRRDLVVDGYPEPAVEVVEPQGAGIQGDFPDFVVNYPLPEHLPDSFTVKLRAVNSLGEDTTSWQVSVIRPEDPAEPPVHKYVFEVDAKDSAGQAHGTIHGDVTFENGQVVLGNDGTQSSGAETGGAYIDLPNGIISSLGDSVTFETWVTWNGPERSLWQRIFDFGCSQGGEDKPTVGWGQYYIFLTPKSGKGTLRFGYFHAEEGGRTLDAAEFSPGDERHLAVSWDGSEQRVRMYVNGCPVAQGETHLSLEDLGDVNNWLGRSQFGANPFFAGSYNEFRIYDYPVSEAEVLGSYLSGPAPSSTVWLSVGDLNTTGAGSRPNIADAIYLLNYLFAAGPPPTCAKAADVNDDNFVDISDVVGILTFLFINRPMTAPDGSVIEPDSHPGCAGYQREDVPDFQILGTTLPGCEIQCTSESK